MSHDQLNIDIKRIHYELRDADGNVIESGEISPNKESDLPLCKGGRGDLLPNTTEVNKNAR